METPSVDPPETRLGPEADVRIHQQGTHCLAIPEACAVPELFAIGISVTRPGDPSRRNGNEKGRPSYVAVLLIRHTFTQRRPIGGNFVIGPIVATKTTHGLITLERHKKGSVKWVVRRVATI